MSRHLHAHPPLQAQRGAVLLLVMILLTVFLIALAAMVSSSFTNLASVGNYVYHEGAVAVTDSVVADAKSFLRTTPDLGVVVAKQYSPVPLPDTAGNGVPANPCVGGGWSCIPVDNTTYPGYAVQFFIERLCNSAGAITATTALTQCQTGRPSGQSTAIPMYDLNAGGGARMLAVSVLYRVTVKVTGPRSTAVTTQTVISKSV